MRNFVCRKCGNCCSRIGGSISDKPDDIKFIRENFYGSMPIINLIPPEKMILSLFDWEAKRLGEKASSLGIKANIIPIQAVFDTTRNNSVILKYGIDHEKCPFLSEKNICGIFESRPFACKQYPFQKGPFLDDDISTDKRTFSPSKLSAECPALDSIELDQKADTIKALYDCFGDTFLAAMQNDLINMWLNDVVLNMMKRDIIKPLMKVEYTAVLEKINNSKMLPFTEFLVSSGMHNWEEMGSILKIFEDYGDMKDKVKELFSQSKR